MIPLDPTPLVNITKCCLHPGAQTSGSELREEECGGKEESQKLKTDQIHQEMEKTNNFPYFVLVPKAEKILSFFFLWLDQTEKGIYVSQLVADERQIL